MIKISVTLFFYILFLTGYSETTPKQSPNINNAATQQTAKIVLIFNLVNALESKIFKEGAISFQYLPKISYMNEEFSEITLNPHPRDTITIISKHDILLKFSSIPERNFLITPNDTFLFENEKKMLTCKVVNGSLQLYDLNFSQKIEEYIINKTHDKIFNTTSENLKENKTLFEKLKFQYVLRIKFLDSMYHLNQISSKYFGLYQEKIKFDFLAICLLREFKPFSNPELKKLLTASSLNNASLIYYPFYQNFLRNYLYNYILPKPIIDTRKHGININYTSVYDTIINLFDKGIVKDYLLVTCLKSINENESALEYLKYYKKSTKDIYDFSSLKSLTVIDTNKLKATNERVLLTGIKKNNEIEYSELLKKYNGYLIYVDIWASWCFPCRKGFPSLEKLKKNFKNDKIIFLHISVDTDFDKWETACKEEQIFGYENNFILLNPKSSPFRNLINLEEIPRCLLYSKNGQILNSKAPLPTANNIVSLLQHLL
jgi:thiol-disulfide isomerase/thioredoxin